MVATASDRLSTRDVTYGGIATRALALGMDAAIANGLVLVLGALIALVASLVGGELRPRWLEALLAAAGWAFVLGSYFTLWWTVTGQTPGMRVMRLRVQTRRGTPPGFFRSLVRLGGLVLAIIPLFAGFLPVLVDSRRRGLPDFLAGTVVVHVPEALAPGG